MLAVVFQIGISCIFYKDTLHSFICIIKESFGRHRIGPPKTLLETTSNIVTKPLTLKRPIVYNEKNNAPLVFLIAYGAGLNKVLWQ